MGRAPKIANRASLWAHVAHWREEKPGETAVVDAGRRWAWEELSVAVDAVVTGFRELGVRRGDRIGMLSWQCVEFVIVYLALERLGATFVGLSPRHRMPELAFLLRDAKPRIVVVSAHLDGALSAETVVAEIRDHHPWVGATLTVHGTLAGAGAFDEMMAVGTTAAPAPPRPTRALVEPESTDDEGDPPICIVYTSGTSGRPKAVRLPNRSLLHNYRLGAELFAHHPFRAYTCHPIDHIGGIDRMYQTIMVGGMMVLDQRFDPERVLERIQTEHLTYVLGEATQFIKLAPHLDAFDLSSLEVVRYVGPLPQDVLESLRRTVPLVMTSYGSSETCASLVFTDASTSLEELRDGNVGHPIDGFVVRVVDGDRRRIVGQVGELEIKSAWIFSGYGAETTAGTPLTDDGWFRPGDLFRENDDGSFTFVGRSNDVYKSGGYNVQPAEIESVLMAHPEVEEACVIGVADPVFITVGKAFVVLRSALDAGVLRAFLREHLAGYKVPKEIVILQEMPLLRNDKIDRKRLQESGAAR